MQTQSMFQARYELCLAGDTGSHTSRAPREALPIPAGPATSSQDGHILWGPEEEEHRSGKTQITHSRRQAKAKG